MKKKRVHIYLLVVLFFLFNNVEAQSNWPEWQSGRIFLSSGDTLIGEVIYEDGLEIVQYMDDSKNKVKTFGAFLVSGFELNFKKYTKNYTRYYWNKGFEHHKKTPEFFITIYNGRIKLLSKERKVLVSDDFNSSPLSFSVNPLGNRFPIYYEETVFNYYILNEDGEIQFVKDFNKYFKNNYPSLRKEIKEIKKNSPNNEIKRVVNVIKMIESKLN